MSDAPAPEDSDKWHKWFAVECNNRAWQVAFAHAVLANAAAANDERSLHATHYARAKALGSALTDDEERTIFEATFRTVPAPG